MKHVTRPRCLSSFFHFSHIAWLWKHEWNFRQNNAIYIMINWNGSSRKCFDVVLWHRGMCTLVWWHSVVDWIMQCFELRYGTWTFIFIHVCYCYSTCYSCNTRYITLMSVVTVTYNEVIMIDFLTCNVLLPGKVCMEVWQSFRLCQGRWRSCSCFVWKKGTGNVHQKCAW
jgi:hypothetical protein